MTWNWLFVRKDVQKNVLQISSTYWQLHKIDFPNFYCKLANFLLFESKKLSCDQRIPFNFEILIWGLNNKSIKIIRTHKRKIEDKENWSKISACQKREHSGFFKFLGPRLEWNLRSKVTLIKDSYRYEWNTTTLIIENLKPVEIWKIISSIFEKF